ncbi:hypothetical protein BLNAU_24147 [Blattamonas nauphoetae]|uniref:Uncharacterized protein n=1 Tax=Blattamonas nauphoetae TaxID=2049346 RepID=A0ABQ9WNA7_9EUKA|nr:hypothetical protein BLNAU_24147 [Blattamonas nauphoetae]
MSAELEEQRLNDKTSDKAAKKELAEEQKASSAAQKSLSSLTASLAQIEREKESLDGKMKQTQDEVSKLKIAVMMIEIHKLINQFYQEWEHGTNAKDPTP